MITLKMNLDTSRVAFRELPGSHVCAQQAAGADVTRARGALIKFMVKQNEWCILKGIGVAGIAAQPFCYTP